jgi:LysM repeat protein
MKTIGIKLADGSFYPVLEDNTPSEKKLELTTAHNNQTKVMVDLYRSANCSMDDAEYVDSLQIENLVARPNGEADIKFTISLDEDNQLSAKIVDSETGNESNTTITLVSRTLEERLVTDEYGINDSNSNGAGAAAAGAVAAGGLLAAAAAMRDKVQDETEVEEETVVENVDDGVPFGEETFVEEPVVEESANEEITSDKTITDDLNLDDNPAEEINFEETSVDETPAEEAPVEETASEETSLPDMDFDLPDETISEDATKTSEVSNELSNELTDMDFDLPDETVSNDDISFDEPANDETVADETISDETVTDNTITEEDSGLPDMDFDIPDDTTETETPEMPDDFFNTDDLDNTEERQETMKDPTFDSVSPAAGGLSFDGLYDEETERGTPAENDADEVKKKTKVPVIICIVCAIICIIATLLILFIIPSKYNLITKKHAKEAATTVAIEEPAPEAEPIPEPEPEPAVPEAKEDEIIIIEKAEEVVPAQPPVAEEKPKNITYKIKWGDTLWDIADTYYKNPWKYKYIARYNGIRNPDYIISGTKIVIPAE